MSPISSPRILASVKSIDVHPKVADDFSQQTVIGGCISVLSAIAMTLLFFSELHTYLATTTKHELLVDTTRNEKLDINFDISFPMMPCSWITLDAMDISGELKFDLDHAVYKQRLDPESGGKIGEKEHHDIVHGKRLEDHDVHNVSCGGCYGAEDAFFKDEKLGLECCSTCQDVLRIPRLS